GLGSEELRPGRTGPPRRGIDPRRVEDRPHGGGADLVAESGEFAVYASIPPGGILRGQAHDQGADGGGDGGSARARVRVVQRRRTSCRCGRRIVAGVTSSPRRRLAGRSWARTAITARSLR